MWLRIPLLKGHHRQNGWNHYYSWRLRHIYLYWYIVYLFLYVFIPVCIYLFSYFSKFAYIYIYTDRSFVIFLFIQLLIHIWIYIYREREKERERERERERFMYLLSAPSMRTNLFMSIRLFIYISLYFYVYGVIWTWALYKCQPGLAVEGGHWVHRSRSTGLQESYIQTWKTEKAMGKSSGNHGFYYVLLP